MSKVNIFVRSNHLMEINANSYKIDEDYLYLIKYVFFVRKIVVAKILRTQIEHVQGLNIHLLNLAPFLIPIYAKRSR